MENISVNNLPVLSIDETVELLGRSFVKTLEAGKTPRDFPSVMLWGPPGVGKSQAVRELAGILKASTGKQVNVTDVRLLLFNPIDLRGIPVANEEKTLAIWLKPQIFQMNEDSDTINILFLDEISAAPQSVQAAAYQITLDRVVGEHKLPDNCFVIAAGNRVTDKSVAYKMPKALANRLLHIEIEGSFNSWSKWAADHSINAKVLGFLSARNERLFGFDPENDDIAFATPRSWEMVSNLLNTVDEEVENIYPLIAGLVGTGDAIEFREWNRVCDEIPDTKDIFAGRTTKIPKGTDAMYALISSMISYAGEHKDDRVQIGNSIAYARKLPADFSELLMHYYRNMEGGESWLRTMPEYMDYVSLRAKGRNGNV